MHEKQEESVGLALQAEGSCLHRPVAVLPLQYLCLLPADQDHEREMGREMHIQVRCVRAIPVHRCSLASGATG